MKDLIERYPKLKVCEESIEKALLMMLDTYKIGGKILLCGNGGSCSDCEHIVGELMKGFLFPRKISSDTEKKIKKYYPDDGDYMVNNLQGSLPAISLPSQSAIISAFSNDVNPDMIYAQLVLGYGKSEDVLIGLSTSGNSKNVVNAIKIAKALGLKTMAMTGQNQCKLDDICDIQIKVPENETYKIQEYHLPIYHYLCMNVEKQLFE